MTDFVPQSPPKECFAIYSQKQFDHIQEVKINNKEKRRNFPYIYYETEDNKLLMILLLYNKHNKYKFIIIIL